MAKLARDVMTPEPACCLPSTPLDEIARMMVQYNCGEIPIVDRSNHPLGVITDRDIVCRVVADGRDPSSYTAEACMSVPAVTVLDEASIDDVIAMMETHQIRRVPVVDNKGTCTGIIAQADIAIVADSPRTADLLTQISKNNGRSAA